ncbi:MAG: hypothetical protein WBJ36_10125, partial [Tenuifilum sp.]|uniref:hypothetical protein n=1 Tax=Tenuifilum sp. TaxID=2760880 RepID=UPI003C9956BD
AEEASRGIKARPVNGSGLSALIFFGSFLYQDMKEREKALCHAFFCCDATFQGCSLKKVLRASVYRWE